MSDTVRWRLHLSSPPSAVYAAISTDDGRARFWAESARESGGDIHFIFPNGLQLLSRVVVAEPPRRFRCTYFGGSVVTFDLVDDGRGGTDLLLTDAGLPVEDVPETTAGWVSVLLSLKAAVDHSVDLRSHDPRRTWDQGYVDN